jgi:hypothetical protein
MIACHTPRHKQIGFGYGFDGSIVSPQLRRLLDSEGELEWSR